MSDLTFNADAHEYRLGAAVLPSVTQIIKAVLPGWQADEYYLQRGRAIHHGCRLLDDGKLDWSTVAEEIKPRVLAWKQFRADFPTQTIASELPMASDKYRFAGTMDRMLREPLRDDLVLVDLKSTIEQQVRIQLGGYSLLWSERPRPLVIPMKAVAVELRDDGTYRCLWLDRSDIRRAEQTFLAALTIFNFQQQHGIKGKQ